MSAQPQKIRDSEPSSNKTRVLIVDDHPMTRSGLAYLINHQPDMATCCEAQNAAQALEGVLQTKPDLVLTDFSLPDKNGLELIKDIKSHSTPNGCSAQEHVATSPRKKAAKD